MIGVRRFGTRPLVRPLRSASARHWLPLSVVVAAWVAAVAWRPFFLGFYGDDWQWTLAEGWEMSLGVQMRVVPSRPLYALSTYVLRLLLRDNAALWQAGLALSGLITALLLYRAFYHLLLGARSSVAAAAWGAAGGAAVWTAFPWSLGYAAWPTMLGIDLLNVAAFALAVSILFADGPERQRVVWFAVVLAAAGLSYEAFWFQQLALAPLYAAWTYIRGGSRKSVVRMIVAGGATQAALTLFTYLAGTSKSVNADVRGALDGDVYRLQVTLVPLFGGMWPWLVEGCVVIVAVAFAAAAPHPRRHMLFVAATLGAGCLGILGSAVLYAVAGYGIAFTGLESRTTIAASFWLALLAAVLVAAGCDWQPWRLVGRLLTSAGAGTLLCGLISATLIQGRGWAQAWDFEQQVISHVPAQAIGAVDPGGWLLVKLPEMEFPVNTFGNYWSISGMLLTEFPELRSTLAPKKNTVALDASSPAMLTTWDGQTLTQAWCVAPSVPLWSFEVNRVALWTYADNTVVPLTFPYTTGCQGAPSP